MYGKEKGRERKKVGKRKEIYFSFMFGRKDEKIEGKKEDRGKIVYKIINLS